MSLYYGGRDKYNQPFEDCIQWQECCQVTGYSSNRASHSRINGRPHQRSLRTSRELSQHPHDAGMKSQHHDRGPQEISPDVLGNPIATSLTTPGDSDSTLGIYDFAV